ncbi:hypothetical protein LTSEHVI_0585 [Salmonella enterica subsp. enterica serovar Hvittingfoss str. A4-620]|nr:hypothetical protein LTSEHVI_0585 [Salmonella enterica subsp. enterica serovar Hvittingfoss str. A4-620]
MSIYDEKHTDFIFTVGGRLLPFNSGGTHAESDVFKHHDVLWYWP